MNVGRRKREKVFENTRLLVLLVYFHVDYFEDILETYIFIFIVNLFLEVRIFMIFIIVLVLVVVDKLCSRKSILAYIILYKYYRVKVHF